MVKWLGVGYLGSSMVRCMLTRVVIGRDWAVALIFMQWLMEAR